jgi:hypothetical protein
MDLGFSTILGMFRPPFMMTEAGAVIRHVQSFPKLS